ncbi:MULTISPECIES: hypothetical protein [Pontibacillus]|uniref:Lipoprotein n=1 Tax=Pontibacillus chungwhensis TaxID=265426 RepID=A0ABY8V3X7_9BACI|nr:MULTISPECIES: hypothetical protein [Pontibacillus]MCD5324394.1 hypothetical protein [Pontibacillus sp. HN14]WIF99310.1 hypothetical protein QNI29_06525 [Pontibacillus chungwhensis]
MKPILFFLGLLLMAFTITACNNQNGNTQYNSTNGEAQTDWALLSLEELTEKADLIAFASVKDTEGIEKSNGMNAQISTLEVLEIISGTASKEIKLDQATNYLEEGEEYLLFLTQNETDGYYYVLNPSGVIQEKDGVYATGLVEGNGTYNKDEVKDLLFN